MLSVRTHPLKSVYVWAAEMAPSVHRSLLQVCQQSPRLNKPAKPLPVALQDLNVSQTDSLFACVPRSISPPLGAPEQFVASKENQADNEWNQPLYVMSYESKQDWLVVEKLIRLARLGCFPWDRSNESPS